jgi:hypothetical protein
VAEARLPSASGVVKDVLGDNALIAYRILCGSIHGSTNTALQSMTRAPLASSVEGVNVVMPTNDPLALIPSLGFAMDGFMTANDRRFEALGWSTEPWKEWKRRTKTTVVQLFRDSEERRRAEKRPAESS